MIVIGSREMEKWGRERKRERERERDGGAVQGMGDMTRYSR